MAEIDELQQAYRQNLGRDASQDELNNWMSGAYGGGGVSDWLNQIATSGEAQQYRGEPQTRTPDPNVNHAYDQPQGGGGGIDQNFWNQIGGAYQSYLGRQASPDEINNWWSGNYGYGSGMSGLSSMQDAIRNSQEALARSNAPDLGFLNTRVANSQAPAGFNQDDWDRAVMGLTAVYKNTLGRDPGPGDIEKWLTGGFGYGNGLKDYDKYVTAIMSSPEARDYRGSGTLDNPSYHSIEYWQSQGVPTIDIFDPMTGQLKPGWARTATGYERTGGATGTGSTGTGTMPPNGDYGALITKLLGNGPASPQALAALEPTLKQYGITLQKDSAGNVRGRLFLPNGEAVDVVGPGGWGQAWTLTNRGKTSGDGAKLPTDQFSDAYTRLLEQLLKGRIGQLGQPVNDPNRAAYEAALKARADALGQGNAQLDQMMGYLQKRYTDLQGPGYTGAEHEVIRTGALDPIEQDRKAAKDRVIARLAQRNIRPGSGVYEAALQEVDKAFDSMRGVTQNQLTTNDLARRENRSARAEAIAGQLADIPDQRSREQLDVFSALNNLSSLARQEEDARQREAISYGGTLADLGPQRLSLAMQAAGMGGGNASSLGSLLTQIAQMNQNGQQYDAQNSNSLWSSLGSLAAIIGRQNQWGLGG